MDSSTPTLKLALQRLASPLTFPVEDVVAAFLMVRNVQQAPPSDVALDLTELSATVKAFVGSLRSGLDQQPDRVDSIFEGIKASLPSSPAKLEIETRRGPTLAEWRKKVEKEALQAAKDVTNSPKRVKQQDWAALAKAAAAFPSLPVYQQAQIAAQQNAVSIVEAALQEQQHDTVILVVSKLLTVPSWGDAAVAVAQRLALHDLSNGPLDTALAKKFIDVFPAVSTIFGRLESVAPAAAATTPLRSPPATTPPSASNHSDASATEGFKTPLHERRVLAFTPSTPSPTTGTGKFQQVLKDALNGPSPARRHNLVICLQRHAAEWASDATTISSWTAHTAQQATAQPLASRHHLRALRDVESALQEVDHPDATTVIAAIQEVTQRVTIAIRTAALPSVLDASNLTLHVTKLKDMRDVVEALEDTAREEPRVALKALVCVFVDRVRRATELSLVHVESPMHHSVDDVVAAVHWVAAVSGNAAAVAEVMGASDVLPDNIHTALNNLVTVLDAAVEAHPIEVDAIVQRTFAKLPSHPLKADLKWKATGRKTERLKTARRDALSASKLLVNCVGRGIEKQCWRLIAEAAALMPDDNEIDKAQREAQHTALGLAREALRPPASYARFGLIAEKVDACLTWSTTTQQLAEDLRKHLDSDYLDRCDVDQLLHHAREVVTVMGCNLDAATNTTTSVLTSLRQRVRHQVETSLVSLFGTIPNRWSAIRDQKQADELESILRYAARCHDALATLYDSVAAFDVVTSAKRLAFADTERLFSQQFCADAESCLTLHRHSLVVPSLAPRLEPLLTQYVTNVAQSVVAFAEALLHSASAQGCEKLVSALMDPRVEPIITQHQRDRALFVAASKGHVTVCTLLMAHGADPNTTTHGDHSKGWCALWIAAKHGHLGVYEVLLPKIRSDDDVRIAAYIALAYRHRDIVSSTHHVDYRAAQPALHVAVQNRDTTAMQVLLDDGIDVNARDANNTGQSAVHIAAAHGYTDLLGVLHAHGAELNALDWKGMTPAMVAAAQGDFCDGVLEALRSWGADLAKTNAAQWSALHHVAWASGRSNTVEFLLSYGLDVNAKVASGWYPAWMAAFQGNLDALRLMRHASTFHLAHYFAAFSKQTHVMEYLAEVLPQVAEPGAAALLGALADGEREVVRALCDVINADFDGSIVLSHAVSRQWSDVVEVLLALRTMDVNLPSTDGQTPLLYAAAGPDEALVRHLLRAGANIHAAADGGWTALLVAAAHGHEGIVAALLEEGASLEARLTDGSAIVPVASRSGNVSLLEFLHARGADFEASNEGGWRAIHYAASNGRLEALQYLIKNHGASIFSTTNDGRTALFVAAANGHGGIVAALLEEGASLEARRTDGSAIVPAAAGSGNVSLLELLHARGADFDASNEEGWRAIHYAASNGHMEALQYLIKNHGASIFSTTNENATPLSCAVEGGHLDIVAALCEMGAQRIPIPDWSPLWQSAFTGRADIVRVLLKHGFDPNESTNDNERWTALHYAVMGDHIDVIRLLVSHGAHIDAPSGLNAQTPLQTAVATGQVAAAVVLIECGANSALCTTEGDTLKAVATSNGHRVVSRLLHRLIEDETL